MFDAIIPYIVRDSKCVHVLYHCHYRPCKTAAMPDSQLQTTVVNRSVARKLKAPESCAILEQLCLFAERTMTETSRLNKNVTTADHYDRCLEKKAAI